MAEAAARPDAELRGFELLDAGGVRAANPAVRGDLLGGLLCTRDAVVEPGLVLGALRVTLEATGRYTWLPRRQVVDVETTAGGTADGRRPPRRPPRGHRPWCSASATVCRDSAGGSAPPWPPRRCAAAASRCCRPPRSASG